MNFGASTHIIVLTPSLGRVSIAREETWGRLLVECDRRGIKLSRNDPTDPGLLPHARNVLLAAAVESDATHAFWWDADVAFDVVGLLDLLERPEAMIVRPYPMRGTDWESLREFLLDRASDWKRDGEAPTVDELRNASMLWSVAIHYENGKPIWSEDGALVRVSHCGFGWVLHKTYVLRNFVGSDGVLWRGGGRLALDWHNRSHLPGFSHLENAQGVLQGEDVSFCQRWREASGQIWAAPDRPIRNGGRVGRFADYLESHGLKRP